MEKYEAYVDVSLNQEQIMALRDLVVQSDLANPMRNDLVNTLAAGLLRFGSAFYETRVKVES